MKRDAWQAQWTSANNKCNDLKRKLGDSEEKVKKLDKECEESIELGKKKVALVAAKEEAENLKARISALEGNVEQVKANDGEEAINAFLSSRAFQRTAAISMADMMRCTLYDYLKRVGRYYPFVPEKLGIHTTLPEQNVPATLTGYFWDRSNDVLIDPKKEIAKAAIDLENGLGSKIYYMWDRSDWPADCTQPRPPVQPQNQDDVVFSEEEKSPFDVATGKEA